MWLQQNVRKLNRNSTFADPLEFTSPGGHLGAFWSSTEQLQTELTGFPTQWTLLCESVAPQYTEAGAGTSLQTSLHNQCHIDVGQIYHVPVEFLLKC